MVSLKKQLDHFISHDDWRKIHSRVAATNTAGATYRWTATIATGKYVDVESAVGESDVALTSMKLGVMTSGATFHIIEHTPSTAASQYYTFNSVERKLTLYPSQKLGVLFTGATAGNHLILLAKGREYNYY